jgi:PIN domain nuclease of toxin-antitoxin system
MRLLVDTQAILWFQSSDDKLSNGARDLIIDKNNICFISAASLWEIAIKINLKKLTLGIAFSHLQQYLIDNDFEILNLEFSHLVTLLKLENHHKDPFDRLIISQAISENMPVISSDQVFKSYPINVVGD